MRMGVSEIREGNPTILGVYIGDPIIFVNPQIAFEEYEGFGD